jgi:hypothetical protein
MGTAPSVFRFPPDILGSGEGKPPAPPTKERSKTMTTADRLEKELREAGADEMMIADALDALYEAEEMFA